MSTSEREDGKALEHIRNLCLYAYQHGYHELGYCPVETLTATIAELRAQVDGLRKRVGKIIAAYDLCELRGQEFGKVVDQIRFGQRAEGSEDDASAALDDAQDDLEAEIDAARLAAKGEK